MQLNVAVRNWIILAFGVLLAILVFGLLVCWIVKVRYQAEKVEQGFTPARVGDPWERPKP